MKHKIKCQNSCCPALEFQGYHVIVTDDYEGAISVLRDDFLEWVEEHVHGDPEEEMAIGTEENWVRLKKWQIAALKAVFEEEVGNHPVVCPA